MSERPAGDVGEDLLHDGVVAVLPLGLDELERRVGEDGVVAPDGEQLVLPGGCFLVQVADPADDQPGGDGLALFRREGGVLNFGDLGVGDPAVQLVVPDRVRVPDRGPGVLADGGDGEAARMLLFTGAVTENRAPWPRTAPMTAALQEAESSRTMIVPVQPQSLAVPAARTARLAAPRAEAAFLPRSRVAAITGAAIGVLITAASAFRPRTSSDFRRSSCARTWRPAFGGRRRVSASSRCQ